MLATRRRRWRLPLSCSANTSHCLHVAAAFLAIYLIWGSTYLAIRIAIETVPPFMMAGLRFLTAGVLLYAWLHFRKAPRPSLVHWRSAAIVGGLLLLGGNGGVTWAEQYVPSSLAALLIATVPMWMVLLDAMRPAGQRPTPPMIMGLIMGLIGIAILIGPADILGGQEISMVGVAALLLAAFSWAIGSLYARRAALPALPLQATALEMLAGGALLLLMGALTGDFQRFDAGALSPRSLVAFVYLVVFGAVVAFTAYGWLLRVSTPARVSTYAYVNPAVAVFLGWGLAGEPISGRMLIAVAVIVLAVALITTARSRARESTS
jgi:drug/metabolite transporter (DMT)-like permease